MRKYVYMYENVVLAVDITLVYLEQEMRLYAGLYILITIKYLEIEEHMW
jgi:hypothetical protein